MAASVARCPYRHTGIRTLTLLALWTLAAQFPLGAITTEAFSMAPSPPASPSPPQPSRRIISKADFPAGDGAIEFITDVEGNWDYFSSLVRRSTVLSFDEDGNLSLAPDSFFVHGGDAPDKGPGDIRVVKALTRLKRECPDRVFLLCGNRDTNKLRFASELAEGETGDRVDIYWDENVVPYRDFLDRNDLPDGSVSTLKWMLECAMGCPTTFETRRMEIAALRDGGVAGSAEYISDEDVLQSFRDSVDPSGEDPWMLDYLRRAQLMATIGDCLFVHGAITGKCLGKVPGRDASVSEVLHLDQWCEALNNYALENIAEYERQPRWDKKRRRGGESIMNYGVPGGFGGATVVYNSFMTNGNCDKPDESVIKYLSNAGIQRVFTGHQPTGDCPAVISTDRVTMFLCDTSYSNTKADKSRNPSNNRGEATTNVIISCESTTVTGVLASGETHGYTLKASGDESLLESLVGKELLDGSWVKSIVGLKLLVARGEGWNVITKRMSVEDVLSQLKQ
uniref:Calcineurin-like phosphoesterase domain-containing protein n=1 Tax=Odontella aurita TaxID=265563 RepID=A0A7S4I846_9STRA